MTIVRLACAAIAALALAACTPAAKPKEYVFADWGCAASFATPPKQTQYPASADGVRPRGFVAETVAPTGAFTVAVFDTAGSTKSDDQMLNDTAQMAGRNGTLTSQTYTAIGKVMGRDVLIDRPGQATMRIRIFVANHHLYQVGGQSPQGPKDPAVVRFLDSFRLL